MKNVGEASSRNQEFNNEFSRERIIQTVVNNPSPVIFDGAHLGESVEYFEIFNTPRIYSFEADETSFQILNLKTEKNYVYNLAIDLNEKVFFYRNSISHTNSVFELIRKFRFYRLVEERNQVYLIIELV